MAPNQIHVAGFLTIYIATRKTSEYSFSGCERGDDVVSSFGGDDQLFGEGGNDFLVGGLGNDFLHGGGIGNDLSHSALLSRAAWTYS